MNLLAAVCYDPSTAASKATSALLAMTAFDTTNLRATVTVPAHGKLRFRIFGGAITGATTLPTILLGFLNGATVVARVTPRDFPATMNAATQTVPIEADFTVSGLTPGSITLDLAYAVQVIVALTTIKYGGPNNASGANAWGALCFEIWDPQPLAISSAALAVNASGQVTAASVAGAVGSVTGNVGGNVVGSVASVTAAVTLPAIPANWITAAGINAGAFNGKGDWLLASGYTAPDNANIGTLATRLTATRATNLDNLDTAISSRSTYAGADTAGTTTLVSRLTALRAAGLDFLDVAISSRLAAASYAAPDNATIGANATAIAAVKAKTDSLTFSVAGKVDGNVAAVNGIAVAGSGTSGAPWGPGP